jgi:signal transduction histidine kinase
MHDVGIAFGAADNRDDMREGWDEQAGGRRGRRRRRWERTPLTPEQKAYRAARRRANARLAFVAHFGAYASVCALVLFVAGFRVAMLLALSWGIGIGAHYFFTLVAPDLRRRFIADEVARELRRDAPRERRSLEDKHARSLEQLSASIAHEIRNPITAAKSLVAQMGEDPRSPESVEYANVALQELDRVERSISHLLRFAREEEFEMRDVSLADVVDSALETFRERIARIGAAVRREIATDGLLRGDAEKLRRALINLIGNALDALEHGRTPQPALELVAGDNLAGTEIWLRVRDNGPGIDPAAAERIFDPFYTSKQSGTGLGLAITRKVIDAHGGSIEVSSSPGAGTEFLITLPRRAAEPAPPGR